MGRRMKEIQLYDDYQQSTEEIDYTAAAEEEEGGDEMNVVKEWLSLLLFAESRVEREEALATIINVLEDGGGSKFCSFHNNKIVENYSVFVLLFDQCLYTIEKCSSTTEVSMAARIIGFLALFTANLGYDVSSTILHKSLPLIYKHLKSPFAIDSTKNVSLLNCLTIINFLVGVGSKEEERLSLNDVIWNKVTKTLGEKKGSALLAYGVFLTSVNRPATIDVVHKTVSYLCSLMDDCSESKVRAISAQLLALIFETYVMTDDVRENVLHRVNYRLAVEESKSQWNVFKNVAEFLEHGSFLPKKKKKDTRRRIQTSSWTDLFRLNFFKEFLGKNGFSEHMENNKLLQTVLKVSFSVAETNRSEKRDGNNYIWMGKKTVQIKKSREVNNDRKILNKERSRSLEKGRMMKAAASSRWMVL